MKKIIYNIVINYQREAEVYLNDLLEHLLNSRIEIYNFFGITPKNKIEINIIPTKGKLDEIFKANFNYDASEFVVGFTPIDKDRYQIYLLSYNDYKNTVHHYKSFEDYKRTLIHEFVHIINVIFSNGLFPITPIWEGVATFLSKQYEDSHEIKVSEEELLEGNCDYRNYYALLSLITRSYNHEDVLKILNTNIDGNIVIEEVLKVQKSIY